jgi:parvulin-like peptidyl-prolyl isomerase
VIAPRKAVVSVLLVAALGTTSCAQTFRQTAAVVNGHRISVKELNAEIVLLNAQTAGQPGGDVTKQALLTLVEAELVRQIGLQRHISPTSADVEARIQELRARFQDEATFQQQLKSAGLTLQALREQIKTQLVQEALQKQLTTPITESDVRTVYRQERAQFRQIMLKHILFSPSDSVTDAQALAKANDALAQIKAGADFGTLAKKLSDDTGSKADGGVLPGWITLSQFDAQLGQAAWAAAIGKVTGPIQTQFGYHLIVTLKKRVQPFAEVSGGIRSQLEQQAGEAALADFATKAVGSAHIEINPRYGDWDAKTGSIVAHEFFRPAQGVSPTPSVAPTIPIVLPS